MKKAQMVDQIEFALSELADARIELQKITQLPIEQPRRGELWAEAESRMVGRCQGMADSAQMFLSLAVESLRQCLNDPKKPIRPLFTTPNTSRSPEQLFEQGRRILESSVLTDQTRRALESLVSVGAPPSSVSAKPPQKRPLK